MIGPMMGHPEGNLSQGFGSGSGFQISLDPDPVFKLLWIRIRILGAKVYINFSKS